MILDARLNLKKTSGKFSQLIIENKEVFRRYFQTDLFPGSLNVWVKNPAGLQQKLDERTYPPAFVIPKEELVGNSRGDGQAWPCRLSCGKFKEPINCWVFRRIGSKVLPGILELVAEQELVKPFGLQDGDPVTLEVQIED